MVWNCYDGQIEQNDKLLFTRVKQGNNNLIMKVEAIFSCEQGDVENNEIEGGIS
jgi:hypothetical protein